LRSKTYIQNSAPYHIKDWKNTLVVFVFGWSPTPKPQRHLNTKTIPYINALPFTFLSYFLGSYCREKYPLMTHSTTCPHCHPGWCWLSKLQKIVQASGWVQTLSCTFSSTLVYRKLWVISSNNWPIVPDPYVFSMCLFRRYHRLRGMFSLCEGSITRGSMILWRVWKVVFLFQFQFFHISTLNLVKLNLILLILKRAWRKKT